MKLAFGEGMLPKSPFEKEYAPGGAPVEIGAVYYRRSGPPERDWDRDYAVAKEDGHTMFRHWFTWNAIHVAPDEFDWAPYDRHLALAAKHGIRTVIAEHIYEAPDWLYRACPDGRLELAGGGAHGSCMGDSDATGVTRMCLDHAEVLAQARRFLEELARHYRDSAGLYGYDIWNECSLYSADSMCYCPSTQRAFRLWLREKYGDSLDRLRESWRRWSISSWEDVELPRSAQPYPDTMDMLRFRGDSAIGFMKMRYDAIRSADPKIMIAAHGNAKTFCDLPACGDDYRAGELCDVYGYTYWYGNKCSPALAGDMIRVAAGDKEYWRAEAIGDADWQARGGEAPMLEKEAMRDPANIRLDALVSFATGARGYLNPRWRALQDGGLFGAFGWYGLDGSRSARSEEVRKLAAWANRPGMEELWRARPVRGQAGLLLLPDAQLLCHAMYRSTEHYSLAYQGAYEAFLDSGIQADPILLRHIGDYRLIYLPFPVALTGAEIDALARWVEAGGLLAAEGCLGYFDERGHAFESQPSRGLAELCGAAQADVSFAPDMWRDLALQTENGRSDGGVYRQSYELAGGRAIAWYEDGGVAGVENAFGKGRARIYGSMLGYGYKRRKNAQSLGAFRALLPLSGQAQLVSHDCNAGLMARVCATPGGESVFLWCVNTTPFAQRAILRIGAEGGEGACGNGSAEGSCGNGSAEGSCGCGNSGGGGGAEGAEGNCGCGGACGNRSAEGAEGSCGRGGNGDTGSAEDSEGAWGGWGAVGSGEAGGRACAVKPWRHGEGARMERGLLYADVPGKDATVLQLL
jgi:beta-galactosidase